MDNYIICNECDGTGKIKLDSFLTKPCPKCIGSGKLTWIENIFGKKDRIIVDESYEKYIKGSKNG